jgi:uncharacterized protein (TIGR00251 family)
VRHFFIMHVRRAAHGSVRPLNCGVSPRKEMPTVLLQIKVKPRARSSELVQAPDGTWMARLKSPPVDGKANQELVALVAAHFKCRKAAVSISSGASGRTKWVKVESA